MALSAAAVLSLSGAAPAKAFLGFGDDGEQIKAQYTDETVCVACMHSSSMLTSWRLTSGSQPMPD